MPRENTYPLDQIGQPSVQTGRAPLALEVVDLACLRDQDAQTPGVYLAYSPRAFNSQQAARRIWFAHDGVDYFQDLGPTNRPTPIGYARTALGSVSDFTVVDTVSTVDVWVWGNSQIEGTTDAGLTVNARRVIIGNEVISFRDATPQGDRVWRLSHLMRGLLGTSDYAGSHYAGERAVFVTHDMHFLPLEPSFFGSTLKFRASWSADDPVTGRSVVYQGYNAKPVRPMNLAAARDGSNNLSFTWDRGARVSYPPGTTDLPLAEVTESYDLVIDPIPPPGAIDPARVNRTIQTPTNSAAYTIGQQTDDALQASGFNASLFQLDGRYGRGRPAQLWVPAP